MAVVCHDCKRSLGTGSEASSLWFAMIRCRPDNADYITRRITSMAGERLVGVDIGTYSSKGVLCTPNGDVLATETIEHGMSIPRPGWAEHDADEIWWGEFVAITRR